jgi:hypothetical protein
MGAIFTLITASGPLAGLFGWMMEWPGLFWLGAGLAGLNLFMNLASGVMRLPVLPAIAVIAGAGFAGDWLAGGAAGLLVYTGVEAIGEIGAIAVKKPWRSRRQMPVAWPGPIPDDVHNEQEDLCEVFGRIASDVAHDLREITDTLSGPDSGLTNAWEEICVQRQDEESYFWEEYEMTVFQCIGWRLRDLPRDLKIQLWFEADESGADDAGEYDEDVLIAHVADNYVYPLAERDSNESIERYLWERC